MTAPVVSFMFLVSAYNALYFLFSLVVNLYHFSALHLICLYFKKRLLWQQMTERTDFSEESGPII